MLLLFFKEHSSHSALCCDISVELSPFAVKSMFWLRSGPITLQEITYPDLVVARTVGEQFLLSSFRKILHDGYFLATVARFANQKWRNYRWVEKRFVCYQQTQFNLHWENFVSDGLQCIVNNRKFKMQRRRESKKSNSLTRQNDNFARADTLFCTFLCRHSHDYHVKMPNFAYCEGRKEAMTKFSFSLWTWIWLI